MLGTHVWFQGLSGVGVPRFSSGILAALLALLAVACTDNPTDPPTEEVGQDEVASQLLSNPDIESGQSTPTGWVPFESEGGAHELDWTVEDALSGSRSLMITGDGGTSIAYWYQALPVSEPVGKTFLLEASIRLDGVSGSGVAIAVRGDEVSLMNCCAEAFATTQELVTITGTRGWTSVDIGLSGVPSSVDSITVYLIHLPDTDGTVYFDDVTLSVVEETSAEAETYFGRALNLMQLNSIRRYELDWAAFRDVAWREVAGAQVASHTYRPIRLALRRIGDNHSRP